VYFDQVASLEKALTNTRTSLKNLHLLPLPDLLARVSLHFTLYGKPKPKCPRIFRTNSRQLVIDE